MSELRKAAEEELEYIKDSIPDNSYERIKQALAKQPLTFPTKDTNYDTEAEPVAWMYKLVDVERVTLHREIAEAISRDGTSVTPLYTHPASNIKRLSDGDISELWCSTGINDGTKALRFANAIMDSMMKWSE